ncbi:MAG: hypothetical protein JNL66_19700 [Alphaproteobacteria bacterium]|nr:hypothetical protein [Alphaproteobacteria bacterium]
MTKLRPVATTAPKTTQRVPRYADLASFAPDGRSGAPLEIERKLAIHQAAQTLRVAADVLVGVECGEPLLNFRVRGLASAVRTVAGELDAILIADDRIVAARRADPGA